MAINEKKPLFVRIAGERQPNLLPVTASAVGFDFNRDRFVFYHTASDDWTDISPDGVEFVGPVYADNIFSAGVVTASLGFSGSLTKLSDGTSYLIAGNNITIASASNGPITISATATSSGSAFTYEFTQAQLTASILPVTHSVGEQYIVAEIYDSTDRKIIPNFVHAIDANIMEVGFASFTPISGTWKFVATYAVQPPAPVVSEYWFSTGSGETYTTGSAKVLGNLTVVGTLFGGSPVKMSGGAVITGSLEVTQAITGNFYSQTGFTGSLTKLSDGTSYLVAASGISITTGANGSVTVANTAVYPPAGSQGQVQYYDGGNLGGSSLFTFDSTTGAVTASSYVSNDAIITTVTSSKSYTDLAEVTGYVRLNPYDTSLVPVGTTTSSYIFSSGANGNLYFKNYHIEDSTVQTISLDWIKAGSLHTGLLYGGKLSSAVGSTTFSITSGSGIIIDYNTSEDREPYPVVTQVKWGNFISQSLTFVTSSQITYIGIDKNASIVQQIVPFNSSDRSSILQLGRVNHPALTTAQLANMFPDVAYGSQEWHDDFIRAFGPLKVSGHKLTTSGSSLRVNKAAGESYIAGGNYFFNSDRPNYILQTEDTDQTNLIYVYLWMSGTDLKILANPPTGYTALDPNYYNLDGTRTVVPSGSFSVLRLYWIPRNSRTVINAYYGSDVYDTLGEAVAGITTENFVESDNTKTSNIFLGYVAVQSGSTDLSDPMKAKIIQGGLSRNVAGGGGAAGTSPASAGGIAGDVQYNLDGTNFGGDSDFTFNSITNVLSVGNATIGGSGQLGGSSVTFDLLDSTVQTINFGGAATLIDIGSAAGTTNLYGSVKVPQGASGSLTHLTDGTSYLIAGENVQVVTGSSGAITISTPSYAIRKAVYLLG